MSLAGNAHLANPRQLQWPTSQIFWQGIFIVSAKILAKKCSKSLLTRICSSVTVRLGRCDSCNFEHRQKMTDGVNSFVRRSRKPELAGGNQSPVSALERKTQGLVAPSGCCLALGIDSRFAERVGSKKQSCSDHYYFGDSPARRSNASPVKRNTVQSLMATAPKFR